MAKPRTLPRPHRTTPSEGVVAHYHEIGLKGRNRGYFERRLVQNLGSMLDPATHDGVELLTGRLFVHTDGRPGAEVLDRIGRTFGVSGFSPATCVEADIAKMTDAALELLSERTFS